MPFNQTFSTNGTHGVAIFKSKGQVQHGWVSFSISKKNVMIYLSCDAHRNYWIGSLQGRSASFKVKFIDNTHAIRVQSSRIVFKQSADYLKIKAAFIRYQYMDAASSTIQFVGRVAI